MRKLTIDLGDERLYCALEVPSAMRSRPMREIVVEALRMWMADQGVHPAEDQLEPQAAAAHADGVFARMHATSTCDLRLWSAPASTMPGAPIASWQG